MKRACRFEFDHELRRRSLWVKQASRSIG